MAAPKNSPASTGERWDFWIDRGGTFTDIIARDPRGRLIPHKLLSENPARYEDAALQGIRDILDVPKEAPIPSHRIGTVRMGSTVATNALLEHTGSPVLFLTTRGFADCLRIGYQNRPRLFDLEIKKQDMLYARAAEIPERIRADGAVTLPLDEDAARAVLDEARKQGLFAVAIAFMHGYRYPDHEQRVAALARAAGFTQVSCSHLANPLMKLVSRGDTTVADAYLSPMLRHYVDRVTNALDGGRGESRTMFMTSSGGLTGKGFFHGKDAVLSGPAGGVVGAVRAAERAGIKRIISFDMGGTSTDTAHYDGVFERNQETVVAGVRLRAPMMTINTIAAGGGSVLSFDGARMRVGPESAGADPGPACYRKNGPLTVTDANMMTGKLQPQFFPALFGPAGDQPPDAETVYAQFAALARRIDKKMTPEDAADGFIKIAVENMAQAIRKISVQRGHDITGHTLVSFGGAGGQHACAVADALGMTRIFIHPLAGLLSAYGIGLADVSAHREHALEIPLDENAGAALTPVRTHLAGETRAELLAQDIDEPSIRTVTRLYLRYEETDTALEIPYHDDTHDRLHRKFMEQHQLRFGFTASEKRIIIESLSVESTGGGDARTGKPHSVTPSPPPPPESRTRFYSQGAWHDAPVWRTDALKPGHETTGPAVLVAPHGIIILEAGWRSVTDTECAFHLTRQDSGNTSAGSHEPVSTAVHPVMLEIFNNLFMSIAEQMGFTLEKTASSVNIKERLDFSCAVFDAAGNLIANAPHMPVHLGSMGASVQAVIRQNPVMAPGDAWVLNTPYNGGTHLPDLTVVMPVFHGTDRLFYVAARGHHADIGGMTPGSMPAFSHRVEEEGVLIDNFRLFDETGFREQALFTLLTSGPFPARNPVQNIADIRAKIAACRKGIQELNAMVAHFGLEVTQAYMGHVQDNAEEHVRRVISVLKPASFETTMDNGARIRVAITVDRKKRNARVDFTGVSPQQENNFNAPAAVTRAAVLYVFRCLVGDDIPMNAGCLRPIEIVIPEHSLLAPRHPAAVVAGNVETSQIITDCLFGALGVMAAAQGTMNNLTFGNEHYQYYETLCGGAGAGYGFNGADAVHTHMTNSRLTDPEVLEWRYPVMVDSFSIRAGSGGRGQWHGGDGVVRCLRFLETMTLTLLSNRRTRAPFGLRGGHPGARGETLVRRAGGSVELLNACDSTTMEPGDSVEIHTPGGGGYGTPERHLSPKED